MITERLYLKPHGKEGKMYIEIDSDSELYTEYREDILKALRTVGSILKG